MPFLSGHDAASLKALAQNDPHEEHDLAFFNVDGERYGFKFDYYELKVERHSPDPSNPRNVPHARLGLLRRYRWT